MDGGDLLLGLRVMLALACVLGLMWYVGRRMAGSGHVRRQRVTAMSVVGRQSLGGKNGLALVEVGGRRLLLGISERGVNLLTEVEHDAEAEAALAATSPVVERVELDPELLSSTVPQSTPAARKPAVLKPRHPLEGSILDASTWRQAVVAVQERTLRH